VEHYHTFLIYLVLGKGSLMVATDVYLLEEEKKLYGAVEMGEPRCRLARFLGGEDDLEKMLKAGNSG
jgi:hypothetical protein